jgi:heat shock protein 90kDa beta
VALTVILTNRLVTSPCTLIADYGFSANMARLMAANVREDDPMYKMMMNAPKILEINPKSPLIVGLLERVIELPEEGAEEEERDLSDLVQVLFDTTSVKSGFTVTDSNE